jgi:hypothetical protein
MGFYIPEDAILHTHRRENLKSYIALTGVLFWATARAHNRTTKTNCVAFSPQANYTD